MATVTRTRSRFTSPRKDQASPLLAVVAWVVALIAFFPVLNMVLTGFKTPPPLAGGAGGGLVPG